MFPQSLLVLLLIILPVTWVSAFCHELGHAVLACLNGFTVSSFGIGLANPLLVWRWRGTVVYLCRTRPAQGLAYMFSPEIYPARRKLAWALAGGVAANALLAGAALLGWRLLPAWEPLWFVTAWLNGTLAVANMLPYTAQAGQFSFRTDGALILQTLRTGGIQAPPAGRLQAFRALRGLREAIGDTLGLYISMLSAASAWAELGAADEAERLWDEAQSLKLEHTPYTRAYGALMGAMIARSAEKAEQSEQRYAEAERLFHAAGNEAGLFLVRWGRVELLLAAGDASRAAEPLDALSAEPLPAGRPVVRAALLTTRLGVRAALDDAAGVEALRAEYEGLRRQAPSLSLDFRFYTALARYYAGREQWAAAQGACRPAMEAVRKLHEALTEAEDQDRFRNAQAGWREELKAVLEKAGKQEEAEGLDGLFAPAEELRRRRTETVEGKNRRWHRAGLLFSAVNLLLGAAAFATFVVISLPNGDRRMGMVWGMLGLTLLLYAAVSLLYSLGLLIADRFTPWAREKGGKTTFTLAVLPWVSWLVALPVLLNPSSHRRPRPRRRRPPMAAPSRRLRSTSAPHCPGAGRPAASASDVSIAWIPGTIRVARPVNTLPGPASTRVWTPSSASRRMVSVQRTLPATCRVSASRISSGVRT